MAEGLTYDVYEVYKTMTAAEIYGMVLSDLADKNDRIIALTADLARSTKINDFFERHPKRAFNFGIAEQNMFGAAAGLALMGYMPFVSTFAAFASMRACEQIRTDIAYQNLPVRIIGTHSGLTMGQGGTTHNSTEDLAIVRSMANMTIVVPADGIETGKLIQASLELPGPLYTRVGRGFEEPVYDDDSYAFRIGEPITVYDCENPVVTIFACGVCVLHAKYAAEILTEDEKIPTRVINMHTLKPINVEAVIEAARATRKIMTAEDHSIIGGLGGAVAEVLAESGVPHKLKRLGIQDVFATIGYPEDLYAHYGIDQNGIIESVTKFVNDQD